MTVSAMTHDTSSRTAAGLGLAVASATSFGLSGALARGLLDTGWSAGATVGLRIAIAALVLVVPGALWMALVRSPHAHARITSIATGDAAANDDDFSHLQPISD